MATLEQATVSPVGAAESEPAPARAPEFGAGWFAATATVLSGIAPLLLIASIPTGPGSSSAWPWAWGLTVLVGLRYAWLVGVGARRLFEIVFWLFTYVFMGLAPLVQMRSGVYPATTPFIDPSRNAVAMAVVGVGVGAFCVGLLAAGRRPAHRGSVILSTISTHRLVGLCAVAALFSVFYMSRVGLGTMFSTRAQRNSAEGAHWHNDTTRAIVKAAATYPLLVGFIALRRLREQRQRVGRRGPSVLVWVVLVLLVIAMNPISSPRYVAGTAILGIATALGATGTVRRLRLVAVTLAAALVLVFPYADLARKPNQGTGALHQGPVTVLSGGDFDAFDQINNTLAYVASEGHTMGQQLVGAALFFVPRAVWHSKAQDTGVLLAHFRGYSFTNLSAPVWAEFFIDGGWALLVLAMALLGWCVRRLDQRTIAGLGALPGRGVLACIAPFYFFIMLRGSLLQSMAGLTVIVVSAGFVSHRR